MANYGKYNIVVRLLLLKQYFEANAGKNRIVSRRELEAFLEEHEMSLEKMTHFSDLEVQITLRHRLSKVFNSCDFSADHQTASLYQNVARRDAVWLFYKISRFELSAAETTQSQKKPSEIKRFQRVWSC